MQQNRNEAKAQKLMKLLCSKGFGNILFAFCLVSMTLREGAGEV